MIYALLAPALLACQPPTHEIARRVEIIRTEYGIPHILADDLEAMGFALGYVQSEDYSASIAVAMVASRGTLALHLGEAELDADFAARETHARAAATFDQLDPRAQAVYRGFAEGVNHYIHLHPDEFPAWVTPDFTGPDALARDVQSWSRGDAARFRRNLATRTAQATAAAPAPDSRPAPDPVLPDALQQPSSPTPSFLLDGSNAWAFHGTRTASGHTILLRNPHLGWGGRNLLARPSGLTYYEAHVRVPGVIDFYGDFRIGTAFGIIGGFNPRLGWATTNNSPTLSQVYRLRAHPELANHAILDGHPLPLERRETTVDYLTETGDTATETRTTWHTPHGPVIHRTEDDIYILKDPRDGEFRRGEQFLRMMMAADLNEWLGVMRMRAHPTSNFIYADADGNIAHYYNARLPLLPHPVTGDTAAFAESSEDIWSELVPWEDLPLYLNPPGGYVQQANDTPDYTNLNVQLDRDTVPHNLPEPRLRLRSQLSLELTAGTASEGGSESADVPESADAPESAGTPDPDPLTLEDVIALKHSPRMLMAERVMDDLLSAARDALDRGAAGGPEGGGDSRLAEALAVLAAWDRTASADSRGGVLFQLWAGGHFSGAPDSLRWRQPWDPERPATTPFGLRDPAAAVNALLAAVDSLRSRAIPLDVRWGDIHRVIRGDVDLPASGCPATLGCFRVLSFAPAGDGDPRRAANRGDAWVLIVEFGEIPRAYTVLAYGQTARNDSPHHADQAAMFARGEMKRIAWTAEEIEAAAIRRYPPGREARR